MTKNISFWSRIFWDKKKKMETKIPDVSAEFTCTWGEFDLGGIIFRPFVTLGWEKFNLQPFSLLGLPTRTIPVKE